MMRLSMHLGVLALYSTMAHGMTISGEEDISLAQVHSKAHSHARAHAHAHSSAHAHSHANEDDKKKEPSQEEKMKKYSKQAYSNLKPALKKLVKFAGPVNGEKLLGMTPVGKMLGLGTPGSLERLRGNNTIAPPQEKGKPAGCSCGTAEMAAMFAQSGLAEDCQCDNMFAQVDEVESALF